MGGLQGGKKKTGKIKTKLFENGGCLEFAFTPVRRAKVSITQFNEIMVERKETLPKTELREYLSVRQQRRWIFPRAALVGLLAGGIALLFRAALSSADAFRGNMIAWAQQFPAAGWLVPVLFTMTGALISVAATRKYAPEVSGSGIPHLEGALQRLRVLNWKRVLPVKFFGGIIAIGSGLALGREGPTVQIGGAVGDAVSRWIKVSERERKTLISAGAGAGLAAAFNARSLA